MLLAVPKYGRVKTNRILNQCRISPSKTIGGLSERQRAELVSLLAAANRRISPSSVARVQSTPRSLRPDDLLGFRRRNGEGIRNHRSLRRRQGDADRASCSSAFPISSSRSRRPRASRAQGEVDGRDYHFLTPEEFDQRIERRRLPRVRHLQRQPLRNPALRGPQAPRPGPLGRARDRGPRSAPGARRDARVGAGLHRPARPRLAAPPAGVARHRQPRGDRRAARGGRAGAGRPAASSPTPSSTTIWSVPPMSWRGSCAPSSVYH